MKKIPLSFSSLLANHLKHLSLSSIIYLHIWRDAMPINIRNRKEEHRLFNEDMIHIVKRLLVGFMHLFMFKIFINWINDVKVLYQTLYFDCLLLYIFSTIVTMFLLETMMDLKGFSWVNGFLYVFTIF